MLGGAPIGALPIASNGLQFKDIGLDVQVNACSAHDKGDPNCAQTRRAYVVTDYSGYVLLAPTLPSSSLEQRFHTTVKLIGRDA